MDPDSTRICESQTPFLRFVKPFGYDHPARFRPKAPPALDSRTYTIDYNEIKDLGRATESSQTPSSLRRHCSDRHRQALCGPRTSAAWPARWTAAALGFYTVWFGTDQFLLTFKGGRQQGRQAHGDASSQAVG